jgi:hypothetical protein
MLSTSHRNFTSSSYALDCSCSSLLLLFTAPALHCSCSSLLLLFTAPALHCSYSSLLLLFITHLFIFEPSLLIAFTPYKSFTANALHSL